MKPTPDLGDESPPRSTPPSSPSPPGTSTAAVWDHEHAIKNRLVCRTQKKISSSYQTVAMSEHLRTSSRDHPRVGERVRARWYTVTAAKNQDRGACPNRCTIARADFFCQLTHPLPPRDIAILILAGHARLGERVREHRQRALSYVYDQLNSALRRPSGSRGVCVGEKNMRFSGEGATGFWWNPDFTCPAQNM